MYGTIVASRYATWGEILNNNHRERGGRDWVKGKLKHKGGGKSSISIESNNRQNTRELCGSLGGKKKKGALKENQNQRDKSYLLRNPRIKFG